MNFDKIMQTNEINVYETRCINFILKRLSVVNKLILKYAFVNIIDRYEKVFYCTDDVILS